MRENSIYAPRTDWPAVAAEAHTMAVVAKTPADTYGAIIYALGQLQQAGDVHTGFENALTAKLRRQSGGTKDAGDGATPTVSLIGHRFGFVELPAIGAVYTSSSARRYALGARTAITKLQARTHPCGWIVDLRQNTGGDDYPMLLSVAPLLGDGHLIGFTGRSGFEYWTSYRHNSLYDGGTVQRAPVDVRNLGATVPVAVLTGSVTASAGEVVAVAFRGRENSRSFGAPTAGATTGPQFYRLADGAVIHFATVWYEDTKSVVYKGPMRPDVALAETADPNLVEQRAESWLASTRACSSHG